MRFLPAILLAGALALSGCAEVGSVIGVNPTVPGKTVLIAANSFDALETVGTAYLTLPLCGSAGASAACHTAAAKAAIVPAIKTGRTARNQLEALLQANNGGNIPVASYNTLEAAIATLQSLYTQYNIQH
jgi:hypothetical protein